MSIVTELFQQNKIFTLREAQELLPLVLKWTRSAQNEVNLLTNRLAALRVVDESAASKTEQQIEQVIERWQKKVQSLGITTKGIWLADFDNGKGYYCWKYPETEISFYHGYSDGFSGRKVIEQNENCDCPN